ncbi:MAG: hypothetical protein P0116_03230 [Candidatus Nitrosocosmicus sp.]|nr:hypothetical protein [Candidatus Nitrosocosmicus sp.]
MIPPKLRKKIQIIPIASQRNLLKITESEQTEQRVSDEDSNSSSDMVEQFESLEDSNNLEKMILSTGIRVGTPIKTKFMTSFITRANPADCISSILVKTRPE